jgi:SAM-dependent methyltransferase
MQHEEDLGTELIFIISLPRSGSTLLQHILAGHSQVAATAEPWVLFPAACALKSGALTADYNASIGRIALSEFLAQLQGGEERYYAAVRRMALHLYNAYMSESGKERFLDKTSRYYQVLPELFRIFPEASYVFLIRNPLATLASFLEYMVFGNWQRLGEPGIRNDLCDGYGLMRQGIRYFGDDAIVVRYEELVERPEAVVAQLCRSLELEFEPEMLNYGERVGVLPGKLVDPRSIHRHQAAVKDYAHAWRSKFTTRQERYLAQAFLAHLGPELVNSLGYSYESMAAVVSGKGRAWAPLLPWSALMVPPGQRSTMQRWRLALARIFQKEDIRPVIKHVGKRVANLPAMAPVRRLVWRAGERPALCRSSSLAQPVSSEYRIVDDTQHFPPSVLHGWQSPSVPERQMAAYCPLLKAMYDGKPRRDFAVAAQALRLMNLSMPTLLEIGCGNGYYYEVLTHLGGASIEYVGSDYSPAMVESARQRYPNLRFAIGDAIELPFADGCFDVAWSGTVLMHIVNYGKAIEETCRIARRFCVFHSTPVLADAPTTFLSKNAYGTRVPEVIINQAEFEHLLHEQGFAIRHILESLPYNAGNVVGGSVHTLTYVCEKR